MMRRQNAGVLLLVALLLGVLPPIAGSQQQQRRRMTAAERRAERELQQSVERFAARVEAILAGRDASVPVPRRAPRPPAPDEEPPPTPEELRARIARGHWGLLVTEADTGRVLYARNTDNYFTPASNTKLYTTALALAVLGPEHRFTTELVARGTLEGGRLRGDLVLVGSGDPNLSNRVIPYDKDKERDGPPEKILAALVEQIVAAGVREIDGDVVVEDPFPYERYATGWAIDDMTAGYGAPVTGVVIADNAIFLEIHPGARIGAPAWFRAEPWAGFYEFTNEVTTGAPGTRTQVEIERQPGSRQVRLRGVIPAEREPLERTLAVEEPGEHAAAVLKRLLEARDVRIYGRTRVLYGAPPPHGTAVVQAMHLSPPLMEAVAVVNKTSQNLHAEMLLRLAAQARTGQATVEQGLEVMEEFLGSIGMAEDHVVLHDGSGLSRRNLITPEATVTLLQWVAQQPWGEAYHASLPVAGEDGTLEERMRDTAAAGRIRAKTGTLGNTNALSGYATTRSGRRLIFSMFGNLHNLRGRPATDVLDALCVAMVEEIGSRAPAQRRR